MIRDSSAYRICKWAALLCLTAVTSACVFLEQPKEAIPTETVPGNGGGASKTLVVVLPGLGDNVSALRKSGIADAIHRAVPSADVQLVGLTLAYYSQGRAVKRLHDEVIAPAQRLGYRDIYLAGASMGGMGVLMYEREYPNVARNLVLFAPYMGDKELIGEVNTAGGLKEWNPGPVPAQLNRDNVPREEWRLVQSWLGNPERARNVWLVCGQSDQFYEASKLVAVVLPKQNYLTPPGGHAWKVWTAAAQDVFADIRKSNSND